MTDNSSPDRIACPHCGHLNRATAKVCVQCGRPLVMKRTTTTTLRKFCPQCGHENSLRAKVCVQCGHIFRSGRLQKPLASKQQKWCPQCGAPHRPGAKVCSQCGYHFRVEPGEEPIKQTPPPAIELPPDTVVPPVDLPANLQGEPAPYISDDELNRLREAGIYHPNVFVRFLHQVKK